ncbi:type II-A CRISPR-associated protein Csn2 [Lagierella massiliensis]|uniref:type II-A CRISPR-associated protein Csn2 n=1 Tax=Lagierella massiliensis TaxID=1689303 RepID=UPI0006D7D02F|nr:type II-A CRISPR-associated protein Csn2 [Lagierella massiliensis]
MNLITEYLENSFEIKSKTINTLVIEDTKYFTQFLKMLIEALNKENEEFELIEDLKKLDISKSTEIIFDLFNIEANNTNILKKLYAELISDINLEEMYSKMMDMESCIINVIYDLIYRSRFPLKMEEVNYQELFKAVGVQFDYDKTSIIERVIEYMKVTSELLNKKLFILINLDSFLSEGDLLELIKFLSYNEIKVLALQNKITREVEPCENLRIVDKDLCEI